MSIKIILLVIVTFSTLAKAQVSVLETINIVNRVGTAWYFSTGKKSSDANCETGRNSSYIAYPFYKKYRKKDKQAVNCSMYFQNESGQFGRKGLALQEHMYKYPNFFKAKPSADMPRICPNFSKFSENQKIHFWVWFMTALALDESSCGNDLKGQGPNGSTAGDFQLEKDPSLRKTRPPVCRTGNILNFNKNADCALAILDVQLRNDKKMFHNPSHWQELNSASGDVYNLIYKYPGCR